MNEKMETTMMTKDRLQHNPGGERMVWLDVARALMLVPVIIEHTEAAFLADPVDNMMLTVFWLSSGHTSRPGFNLLTKAKVILLPYVLMCLLCLLFTWFYMGDPFSADQLWGVLYGRFAIWKGSEGTWHPLLMKAYNSVLWFLPSLFTAFIVFRLLISVRGVIWNILALLGCVILSDILTRLPLFLPWSLDTAPVFGAMIYAGRLLRLSDWTNYQWYVLIGGGIIYFGLNRLNGLGNISLGDFGTSIWIWAPTAFIGATAFITLCRMIRSLRVSRIIAWFNDGALFIFGMQLVFIKLAEESYANFYPESWKVRLLIVLIFCFAGGKLFALLYRPFAAAKRQDG